MGRQMRIAGTEGPQQDEKLNELLGQRQKLATKMSKTREELGVVNQAITDLMRELKLKNYTDEDHNPPLMATLTDTAKLKVQEKEDGSSSSEDEDESAH